MNAATPPRILVVDDSEKNSRLLVDLLNAKGHRASAAASGEEALERIAVDPPDLLLLDVMMPGLSGYDVCERLRADPRHAFLPIVLVTALDPAKERLRGLEAGADDFLSKPINPSELLARVRSLLRVKGLHDEVLRLRAAARDDGAAGADATAAGATAAGDHEGEVFVVRIEWRGLHAHADAGTLGRLRRLAQAVAALAGEHGGAIERLHADGAAVVFDAADSDAARRALRFAIGVHVRWREASAAVANGALDETLVVAIARGPACTGAALAARGNDAQAAVGPAMAAAAMLAAQAAAGEIRVDASCAAALAAEGRFEPADRGPSRDPPAWVWLGSHA